MKGILKTLAILPAILLTAVVTAQPVDIIRTPEHKKIMLDAVLYNIVSRHYSPKPIDNRFALAVWNNFLHYLDSNRTIFRQEDINGLAFHQQYIDEQLKNGSAAFFDDAIAIYKKRVNEIQSLYTGLLQSDLQVNKKEMFGPNAKNKQYPAGNTEQSEAWRKQLKYEYLKRSVSVKQSASSIGPELEASIRKSIRKQYDASFSQQLTSSSITEKFYRYVNIITLQMDPHSTFVEPDITRAPPGFDGKSYFSAGFTLREEAGEHYIDDVIEGSAAALSGQTPGNRRIIAIADPAGNMVSISGKTALEVSHLLSGKKEAALTMLIENESLEETRVNIPREEMRYNSYKVKSAILTNNGKKTGYISFPFFYGNLGIKNDFGVEADMLRELAKLKDQEIEALIIDLRGNPGGSTGEAERMVGDLVGGGDVSVLKGKYGEQRLGNPAAAKAVFTGPLTIMLDESSASSSEIFAAAIQDHGRGIIIGTASSFGKGTAQTTIGITKSSNGKTESNYGLLRLTEKKFYRINGSSTQLKGVIPDIIIQSRMHMNSIREADYPTALPSDTLQVINFHPAKPAFDYAWVVQQSKSRINNNAAIKKIRYAMQQLAQLQQTPFELTVQGFTTHAKSLAQLEATIKKARELEPDQLLQVSSSLPPWINPDILLPFEHLQYQHWLNNLKKDIYLAEALTVTTDMLMHP